MDLKQVIGAVIATVVRVAISVVVIVVVFRLAVSSYDFGFRIFAEQPMAEGTGRTVSVAILEGKDAMDIGKMLKEKGLIRDEKLFYIQEKLSNYHNMIQPGVYELNTAMTIEQMIEVMATAEEGDTSSDILDNNDTSDTVPETVSDVETESVEE